MCMARNVRCSPALWAEVRYTGDTRITRRALAEYSCLACLGGPASDVPFPKRCGLYIQDEYKPSVHMTMCASCETIGPANPLFCPAGVWGTVWGDSRNGSKSRKNAGVSRFSLSLDSTRKEAIPAHAMSCG